MYMYSCVLTAFKQQTNINTIPCIYQWLASGYVCFIAVSSGLYYVKECNE